MAVGDQEVLLHCIADFVCVVPSCLNNKLLILIKAVCMEVFYHER